MFKSLKTLILTLLVATALALGAQERSSKPTNTVIGMDIQDYRIYVKDQPPLDRLYCWQDTCFFLVDNRSLDKIKELGIPFQEQPIHIPSFHTLEGGANGVYHSYRETESLLFDLESRFPHLARVFTIGQSIEGRQLYVIKISDNAGIEEGEVNIFIVGCHHAREWISVEVPLLFAQYLLENYPEEPQVKTALEGGQIYILPLVNPDGLEFSIHSYRMWRKNRRYNGYFSWGVDNNRNYGFKWGYDSSGSSPLPDSEVYRGPAPFSEPETAAVRSFLLAHPPAGSLNFHNFSQMILYPWGYTTEPTPDDAEMSQIAAEMSEQILQVNGRTYQYGPGAATIYPTNGDLDDWVYGTFAVPAFTIELPPSEFFAGGFFTSQEEIDLAFAENLPALLYFVNYFVSNDVNTPAPPHVQPDKNTKKPDRSR